MFFASRHQPPSVSDTFSQCAELFQQGRTLEARRRAWALREASQAPTCAEDYLLLADLAHAALLEKERVWVLGQAEKRFSDDWRLGLSAAQAEASQGRLMAAERSVRGLLDVTPTAARPLLLAFLAGICGLMELADRAARHSAEALDRGTVDDPKVWCLLAAAAVHLRSWDAAIERGRRAVELAPAWPRARLLLLEALLARGLTREAEVLLWEGVRSGVEDAALELVGGMLAFRREQQAAAFQLLCRYELSWTRQRGEQSLREILPLLPWNPAAISDQLDTVTRAAPELHQRFIELPQSRRHKLLPIPLMRQERLLCVPTAVAMVSAAQGLTQNPHELFEAMTGRHGTATWRMVDEMQKRGFEAHWVSVRPESVRHLLDQGVPLIGQIEGLFHGHVEVISGYDADLGVFYLSDPESWFPAVLPENALAERYESSGDGVLALVAPDRRHQVRVENDCLAPFAAALCDLETACASGEREAAEEAHEKIPDSHPAAFRRNSIGRGITLTPTQMTRSLERIARDSEAPPLARVRALLSLDPIAIEEILENGGLGELAEMVMPFVDLRLLHFQGDWTALLEHTDKLLEENPMIDQLWLYRCEALAQMGHQEEARAAAETALELAPDSASVRRAVRQIFPHRRSYQDEYRELTELIERHPFDHELKEDLAHVLLQGADGRQYERAELDCQRYWPRLPQSYMRVAEWYLRQGRLDLAGECLERGRGLIGEAELPRWGFEKESAQENTRGRQEEALGQVQADLPETPPELLLAAWRELSDLTQKQSAPNAERRQQRALDTLRERRRAGRLQWFEAAETLAAELAWEALASDEEGAEEAAVRELLPDSLPGPLGGALTVLLEHCGVEMWPRRSVVLLRDWVMALEETASFPPPAQFWLGLLLELSGDLNGAQRRYHALSKNQPGFALPYHRLAQIAAQQGRLETSLTTHRKALDASPGLADSLAAQVDLSFHLGRREEGCRAQKALVSLLPYSTEPLGELARSILVDHGYERAIREIDSRQRFHSQGSLHALRSRIYAEAGRHYEALRTLELHPEALQAEPLECLFAQLQCAGAKRDEQKLEELLAAGVEAHPKHIGLLAFRGERLRRRDPTDAFHFYRDLMLRGLHDPMIAGGYLRLFPRGRAKKVLELLQDAEGQKREQVASAFTEAMARDGMLLDLIHVLRWCHKQMPHLAHFRELLTRSLLDAGKVPEARKLARGLLDSDPDSPSYKGLMARCVVGRDPERALKLFQEEHDLTGSLETLCHMARCHQLLDRIEPAKKLYHQVLSNAPDEPLALANLTLLGDTSPKLHNNFRIALERGYGADVPYFHVGAVQVARAAKRPVPQVWIQTASLRLRTVHDEGGMADEQLRLAVAIAAWLIARGDQAKAAEVRKMSGSTPRRLALELTWPGSSWVPPPPRRRS